MIKRKDGQRPEGFCPVLHKEYYDSRFIFIADTGVLFTDCSRSGAVLVRDPGGISEKVIPEMSAEQYASADRTASGASGAGADLL